MTSLIKYKDPFDLPSVLDIMFPRKVLKDDPDWGAFFTTDVFPYDVKQTKDKDGNLVKTELIFAVAGIKKEDVDVKVEYDYITISIDQTKEDIDEGVEYVRKGLSHRSMIKSFYVQNIDKENIKSKLENGLLTITLPTEPQAQKKMFKVNVE